MQYVGGLDRVRELLKTAVLEDDLRSGGGVGESPSSVAAREAKSHRIGSEAESGLESGRGRSEEAVVAIGVYKWRGGACMGKRN